MLCCAAKKSFYRTPKILRGVSTSKLEGPKLQSINWFNRPKVAGFLFDNKSIMIIPFRWKRRLMP